MFVLIDSLIFPRTSELPQVHLDMPHVQAPSADTGQSTTDMFLDMFTKKGKFLSKLTSFDSEVENLNICIHTLWRIRRSYIKFLGSILSTEMSFKLAQ